MALVPAYPLLADIVGVILFCSLKLDTLPTIEGSTASIVLDNLE